MIDRLVLAFAVLLAIVPAGRAEDPPRVTTDSGVVLGRAEGGVNVYRGIPYAAPPVGPLRWKPPQPPLSWSEPRDAGSFGPICPQPARESRPGLGADARRDEPEVVLQPAAMDARKSTPSNLVRCTMPPSACFIFTCLRRPQCVCLMAAIRRNTDASLPHNPAVRSNINATHAANAGSISSALRPPLSARDSVNAP